MCWHKWTRWKQYVSRVKVAKELVKGSLAQELNEEFRQQRICLKCGYTEDQIITHGQGLPQDFSLQKELDLK